MKTVLSYPFSYKGSYFWLVLFLLILPPFGFCLLIKGLRVTINHVVYFVHYKGTYLWLLLWAFACFPIAFILAFINGFDLQEDDEQKN